MTPVSLSLHRIASFFSHAVSTLLTSASVGSEGLHQLSRLTLWAVSFSTILHLRCHSNASSSILGRTPASRSLASRPNTSVDKSGTAGMESSRDSGSTSSASPSTWFNPHGWPSGSLRMWLSSTFHSRFQGRTPLFPFWFHTPFGVPVSHKLRETEQLGPADHSGNCSLIFLHGHRNRDLSFVVRVPRFNRFVRFIERIHRVLQLTDALYTVPVRESSI